MDLINKEVAAGNFELHQNVQRVKYENDGKLLNFATITVNEEDHTLGNILRQQLLRDKRTKFAGYRKPHPLFNLVEIKVQTNGQAEPWRLVQQACTDLSDHINKIDQSFDQALEKYKEEQRGGYEHM